MTYTGALNWNVKNVSDGFSGLFAASLLPMHVCAHVHRSFRFLRATVKKKGQMSRANATQQIPSLAGARSARVSRCSRVNSCRSWILHRAGKVHAIRCQIPRSPFPSMYTHTRARFCVVIPRRNLYATVQLDAQRATNLRAANVCVVAGIKDTPYTLLLSA